jgi:HTH-type transcriptional regulator/antitoxin HigA
MLKIIKNEIEYEDALARAYELIQLNIIEGSDLANELEILTLLIEHYEKQNYPISSP